MFGLHAIVVGDPPAHWEAAGFEVRSAETGVDALRVRCADDGDDAPRWVLASDDPDRVPSSVDGLATSGVDFDDPADWRHPNGITGLDHVVLRSPDLDRTTAAFGSLGIELRRTRDVGSGDRAFQQRFFRIGPVILELVGPPSASGDDPLAIWGLAFVSADIDATAASLGDRCSAPKGAVQPGRRIATIDTESLGIGLHLAVMTPHVRTR